MRGATLCFVSGYVFYVLCCAVRVGVMSRTHICMRIYYESCVLLLLLSSPLSQVNL